MALFTNFPISLKLRQLCRRRSYEETSVATPRLLSFFLIHIFNAKYEMSKVTLQKLEAYYLSFASGFRRTEFHLYNFVRRIFYYVFCDFLSYYEAHKIINRILF